MKDLRVSLPKPCSEPWEGMSPRGCNRQCASCDKIIHDLSALTIDEAEELLTSEGEVCVRASLDCDGVVQLAGHSKRRMIAVVGAGLTLATAACQTIPPEERPNRFEITGELPYGFVEKPEVRSNDGQIWPVEMEFRSSSFRVPNLYPGVYSITYQSACHAPPSTLENVQIRDESIHLGMLEGEGQCIIVGVIIPRDPPRRA